MFSLRINALGVGAVKKGAPTLCMGFLCYLGVSAAPGLNFPHMVPVCHPPLPALGSSCLLAIFFLFLEMISSGEKSGLVWFPLSGGCCPSWSWRPSLCRSRSVRRDTGKGKWKGSGTPGGTHLPSSGGDETKKLFFHQQANSSPLSPKHHALSLVLSVPSLAIIFKSLLSSFSTRAWPPCQPLTSP